MASGSFAVSTSNSQVNGSITWSSTTDINNNRSTVTATLKLSRTNTGYTTYGDGSFAIYINGVAKTNSQNYTITYNSNTVMVTNTVVVPHNADGTKSISITAYGSMSGVLSVSSQGGTVALDTIPRASTISYFPNFIIGDDVEIRINRASSSFTHTLVMYLNGTYIGEWHNVGSSIILSLNETQLDRLYNGIPNSTSATVTLSCSTYNGTTKIGDNTFKTATAMVGNSIMPSFTNFTAHEKNQKVIDQGLEYVQNLSSIEFTINGATAGRGATIESYRISFEGRTYWEQSVTTGVYQSGTLRAIATITDSRGRIVSRSINIIVIPYNPPEITKLSIRRCNFDGTENPIGTYAKVDIGGRISSLNSKNTLMYTIESKSRGATAWRGKKQVTIQGTSLDITEVVSAYTITQSYDFRVTITDKFNTTESIKNMSTGEVTMSWGRTGIGVGKVWEQGALDVYGDIYENGVQLPDKYLLKKLFQDHLEAGMHIEFIGYNSSGYYMQIGLGTFFCWAEHFESNISINNGQVYRTPWYAYPVIYSSTPIVLVSKTGPSDATFITDVEIGTSSFRVTIRNESGVTRSGDVNIRALIIGEVRR